MATAKTESNVLGDLIVWENEPNYTRESVAFKNSSAATLVDYTTIVGTPAKEISAGIWAPVLNLDEANAAGLFISGPSIDSLAAAGVTNEDYAVITKGPALIKDDGIVVDDLDGTTLVQATLKTALAALSIDTLSVPPTTDTQTT